MTTTLRSSRIALLVLTLAAAVIMSASNLVAQGAYKISSGNATGGSIYEVGSFSIKALDNIEIKRLGQRMYVSGATPYTGPLEVWYKPGPIATAAANSTGWTKLFTHTGTYVQYNQAFYTIPVDCNIVLTTGQEMSFAICGKEPARTVWGTVSATNPAIISNSFAEVNYNGRGGSFTVGNPPSFYTGTTSHWQGEVDFDLAGANIVWAGGTSSDWNTASNWSGSTVPTESDFVTIPDASSTNNDPVLASNSKSRDLTIASGGILNGGSGKLDCNGGWTNNGTFNKGTSTVSFFNTANQNVDNGNSTFYNVIVKNGRTTLNSSISSADFNSLVVESTGEIAVGGTVVNLTGSYLSNSGKLILFGNTATQTVTTNPNQYFATLEVSPTSTSHKVVFTGTQNFNKLQIGGDGSVTFPSALTVSGEFQYTGKPNLVTTGSSYPTVNGSADIIVGNSSTFRLNVNVGNADITLNGTSTTYLYGTIGGNLYHQSTGYLYLYGDYTGNTFDHTSNGGFRHYGNFTGSLYKRSGSSYAYFQYEFDGADFVSTSTSANVYFYGKAAFDNMEISGASSIYIYNEIATANTFTHEGKGVIQLDRGLIVDSDLSLETDGGNGTVYVTGDLTVNGDLEVNPTANVNNNVLYVTGNSMVAGDGYFRQSNAVFEGTLTIGAITIEKEAILDINSSSETTFDSLTIKNSGRLEILNSLTVKGAVSTANASSFLVSQNMTVQGNITIGSTSASNISGELLLDGTNLSSALVLNLSSNLNVSRAIMDCANGVTLTGILKTSLTGPSSPCLDVNSGTNLKMNDDSRVQLGDGGLARIDGTLTTTAGETGDAPKLIGGSTPQNYSSVVFGSTSTLDLDGMNFERIGNANVGYALVIEDGATIVKFDSVRVPDSNAGYGIIELKTSNMVTEVNYLVLGGISPTNVNATGVSGITITFLNGSGSLYGKDYEEDPSQLLFWDASPIVLIQNPTQLIRAYTERDYAENSQFILAIGGNAPYLYGLANNPSWLEVNVLTGELYGSPALSDIGSISFDLVVADSTEGVAAVTKTVQIEIEKAPYFPVAFVSDGMLPDARADDIYAALVEIVDGTKPYTFSLVGAQAWLSIDPVTGEITGTPPLLFEGPVSFTVKVQDSEEGVGPASKVFTILVQSSGYKQIVIESPGQLPNAIEGQAYNFGIEIRDGVAPHTFTLLAAPSWLTINAATGELSGTPPLGIYGTVSFSVQVGDEREGAPMPTKSFQIEVTEIPYTPVSITTAALLPLAPQGQPYTFTMTAVNGLPGYTFSLENEPSWLSIDSTTGELSGIPPSTFSGYVNFRVIVNDTKPGQPGVAKDFALEVQRVGDDPVLVNTPPVLFNGTVGASYYIVLAASGGTDANYTWFMRAGHSLPAGLVLDGVTGIISGRPEQSAAGAFTFDIGARDSMGNESFQTFSLTIDEQAVQSSGLVGGTNGDYDLPERAAAGGCALASGSSLWVLALMLLLGALTTLRATRGRVS